MVWLAMLMSTGMYVAILFTVELPEAGAPDELLLAGLASASLGVLLAIPVVRKAMMGSVALIPPKALRRPELDPETRSARLQRYFTGTIVGLALAESVAVFGFVGAFTQGDPLIVFPFVAAAVAMLAVQMPREACLCLVEPAPRT